MLLAWGGTRSQSGNQVDSWLCGNPPSFLFGGAAIRKDAGRVEASLDTPDSFPVCPSGYVPSKTAIPRRERES